MTGSLPSRLLLCSTSSVLLRAADDLVRGGQVTIAATTYPGSGTHPCHVDMHPVMEAGLRGDFRGVNMQRLTADLIEGMAWAEPLIYPMMDRIDPMRSQSASQRRLLFQYLCCYWSEFLTASKIDLVLFGVVPHEVADFVLFAVCKYLGLKTLIANYTRLPGVCYFTTGIGTGGMMSRHDAARPVSEGVRGYIADVRKDYAAAIPKDTKEFLEKDFAPPQLASLVGRLRRGGMSLVSYALATATLVAHGNPRRLRNFAHRKAVESDWKSVQLEYPRRTKHFKNPEKFVYFLLNFQPESTTSPLGRRFVDQHIAIAMLSRFLPDDYAVVVKEHPAQLIDFNHYNYLGRDRHFYERLLQIPRVVLAPFSLDHFDSLDRSIAVASVNGTVGWEAAVRRKPALVFGDAWYEKAPGVFKIENDAACRAAIREILAGKVEIADAAIDAFVVQLLASCEYLCLNSEDARIAGVPFDEDRNAAVARDAIAYGFGLNTAAHAARSTSP